MLSTSLPLATRRLLWQLVAVFAVALLWSGCHGLRPKPGTVYTVEKLETLTFGACAHHSRPQPIWDHVREARPDLFVFLGDTIYSDAENARELAAEYQELAAKPGFARLREETPILATWDDHEFGVNDGGAENPRKEMFERAFLDFFEVPESSPRRARPGVYGARIFGPPGERVQVLLLDTRYFRSPLRRNPAGESEEHGRYLPLDDSEATMLGSEQWRWLEGELRKPAELRVLASSIQVIPEQHGWEKWGNMPRERRRLLRLIRETGAAGVVLVSGDRHLGEISRLPADHPDGVGYPLYELTVGGINQRNGLPPEPNRYRVGSERAYRDPSFGALTIDWREKGPRLELQLRDEQGTPVIRQSIDSTRLGSERE